MEVINRLNLNIDETFMKNYLEIKHFSYPIRFIEVKTESYQYVKTICLVQRDPACWFYYSWAGTKSEMRGMAGGTDQMILHATSIDQNWHEFTPTASMSISQRSKNSADLVFIKISGDNMCAVSSGGRERYPQELEWNLKWDGGEPGWERTGERVTISQ